MNNVTKNKSLRVAMIAPPWLPVPVSGYGGVENVIDSLTRALIKQGVQVELFTVKGSKLAGAKIHEITARPEFDNVLKPMYDFALPPQCAHVIDSLEAIRRDGNFDIIHDHNYFIGPSILAYATCQKDIPPAIHTIHGPPLTPREQVKEGVADNRNFWRSMATQQGCKFVSISDAMRYAMPAELEKSGNMLDTVYNMVDANDFPFVPKSGKKNYFVTLGGFSPDKNQGLAAKVCAKKRKRLRMAGPVVDMKNVQTVMLELANPLSKYRNNRNFKYFSDKVLPHILKSPYVSYSGMVAGREKLKFLSEAKALIHPIEWNEPFGMVVIEAMACGTPVIAMNKGAMPEIIEHGVNGFLVKNEQELGEAIDRIGEIDPEACRRTVEEKFSAAAAAHGYIERYYQTIGLANK